MNTDYVVWIDYGRSSANQQAIGVSEAELSDKIAELKANPHIKKFTVFQRQKSYTQQPSWREE